MANSDDIYLNIIQNLKYYSDKSPKKERKKFFKENIKSSGVSLKIIRKIVNNAIKNNKKRSYLSAKRLLTSKIFEEKCAGIILLSKSLDVHSLTTKDLNVIILNYLDNWALCDLFSTEVCVELFDKDITFRKGILKWVNSKNPWVTRVGVVTVIKSNSLHLIEKKRVISDLKKKNISSYIVQKAVNWLEREIKNNQ